MLKLVTSLCLLACSVVAMSAPRFAVVNVYESPIDGGITTGNGSYRIGSIVSISATPLAGFSFSSWNDYNTNATRLISVHRGNNNYTAIFFKDLVPPPITVYVNQYVYWWPSVDSSYTLVYGDNSTFTNQASLVATNTTITGLVSNKTYFFYVKTAGTNSLTSCQISLQVPGSTSCVTR